MSEGYAQLRDFVASVQSDALKGLVRPAAEGPVRVEGLAASSPALVISKLFLQHQKYALVVCHSQKVAEGVQSDLEGFLGEELVHYFPHREASIYDGHSPFGHTAEMRLEVLRSLVSRKPSVVVTTIQALMQQIVPPKELSAAVVRLEVHQPLDLTEFRAWLIQMGFEQSPAVEEIGQFSVRGGIVDVFPFLYDHPLRIELWGDEVESIRKFDVFTQRSVDKLQVVEIFPTQEFLVDEEEMEEGFLQLQEGFADDENMEDLERKIRAGGKDTGVEWHIGWFKERLASLLDYFAPESLVFEHQSSQSWGSHHRELYDLYRQCFAKAQSHGYPLYSPPDRLLWDEAHLRERFSTMAMVEIGFLKTAEKAIRLGVKEQPRYLGGVASFVEDAKILRRDRYTLGVLCDNQAQATRLTELLGDDVVLVNLIVGYVQHGFLMEELKLALYTDHQIFSRYARKVKYRKYKGGVSIPSFEALTPGDFVVHTDHGIGRFLGIERTQAGEGERDCMVIAYAENNKLFVPVESFEKVQKYVGKDGTPPALSRLGGKAWEKIKARTKKAIVTMARDLLDLYAKRKYLPGHAFAPDTNWQKEFEEAFIYDETPDQIKSIDAVKKDLEQGHPADRLVCGDVGFGKTEVAMRAAFKCAMEGKQTALLVPTTVLAAQHLQTFRERMADFPVRVAMLSRFISAKEKKKVIEEINKGEVEIVIGTHALLSKKIQFKNLGLLVVDEEHRFGVRHKEQIKQLKENVDVLSMTATPIPRTLHMSMIGVRDISVINTPPLNRLAIQTRVLEFTEELVQDAIEQELAREGQVYLVHNRVQSIDAVAEMVERLVPNARVAIGHGQMPERDLEKVMDSFTKGHFDVLVSTSIIESGLDIPNVNTLIANRADMMGLAQLYQLRGRVGRSSVQAYAYLLTPSFAHLNDNALRRLKTLEQFTDLGSGFQIAMRDLEIRGAGNILGTEQHGFVVAVGFEMYVKLLREAIEELKGQTPTVSIDPKIDIETQAYFSDSYIADREQRVAVYQKISQRETVDEIHEMENELRDRFGELPKEARALLAIMALKLLAKKLLFGRVAMKYDRLLLEFAEGVEPQKEQLGILVERIQKPFEFLYGTPLKISIEITEIEPFLRLKQAERVLELMASDKPAQDTGKDSQPPALPRS